jgi:adenosylmethionine-8-amino-7-oxononanoate aminotransferase
VPPTSGYFRAIRAVCDKYGVLLILDEVMAGMGRTGHLFACTEDGVIPDIIAIAKGLGAGYQPIGAMIAHDRIYDAVVGGSGFFQHGHTYLGHPIACAAALEVQKTIAEENLLANVLAMGERLNDRLRAALADHPNVGDVRGRGLFRGIELVANRTSKEPLDPSKRTHARIKAEAMRRGLLVYPMGGTLDGVRGDHILLAPPFTCTESDIDLIVERLKETIDAVLPSR